MSAGADLAAFERASQFRLALAAYLGRSDVENVGIALGPSDDPLVTMPLAHAERLLRDAESGRVARPTGADGPPDPESDGSVAQAARRHGDALMRLVGRPVTITRHRKPPVVGYVRRVTLALYNVADDPGPPPVVEVATDRQGDVEVPLAEIESVSAGGVVA